MDVVFGLALLGVLILIALQLLVTSRRLFALLVPSSLKKNDKHAEGMPTYSIEALDGREANWYVDTAVADNGAAMSSRTRKPQASRTVDNVERREPRSSSSGIEHTFAHLSAAEEVSRSASGEHESERERPRFTVSYSHPRQLAKGMAKLHIVALYLPSFHAEVDGIMHKKFGAEPLAESFADQYVEQGKRVVVELSSPAIKFDPPVTLQLTEPVNVADFGGIPDEACRPGVHTVRVRVQDAQTAVQYVSHVAYVEVVDYAFGKVSRPALQRVVSIASGAGAVIMWGLALLEQIDKTVGFAGGTAAAALAAIASEISDEWFTNRTYLTMENSANK